MPKKVNKNSEKGSVAVYVICVILSFLIILTGIFVTSASVRKNQLKTILSIKESYEKDNDKIEEIYTERENKDIPTIEEALTSETPFEKTTKITDGKDTMWVPEKFTVIEGDKIDDGIVVQDPDKNEFVWVPVKKINDMVYCYDHPNSIVSYNEAEDKLECEQCKTQNKETTNFAGKLYASNTEVGNKFDENTVQTGYNASNSSYKGIREPDIVMGNGEEHDAVADNLKIILESYTSASNANTLKIYLQTEFNKMAKSVSKYKGFYVGRYETSGLSNSGTTYEEINKGKVLKGQTSINNATWYRQYVINKKIGSNYTTVATTSMIWGCQWDQVMIWMKEVNNTKDTSKKYIKDSTEMGNYAGTQEGETKVIPTGKNENYAIKNIYDMAGNLYEMTIEAGGGGVRSFRGGQNSSSSSTEPASYRTSYNPGSDYGKWSGSRSTLYIV